MNPPSEKKLNRLSPNMLKYGIPKQLIRDYDGKKFEGYREACDRCGSTNIQRRGFDKRVYATVIEQSGFHDVNVYLQKYSCKECHHVMVCDEELFYPHIKYGKGIVDACLFLTSSNPYNRVERIMQDYGIQVDIQSIRRYAIRFGKKAAERAPLKAMGGKVDLGANLVSVIFEKDDAKEVKSEHPDEKHDAVADETYPPVKGAKGALREENRVKASIGERQKERFGDSFTLAASYLHNLHCYASLICTRTPFNSILAEALIGPLHGCDYILSDGSRAYNGLVDERCLWHFMKRFFNKSDAGLMRMKRKKMLPQIVSQHMREIYSVAREEYLRYLMEKYPGMISRLDNGSYAFLGAMTTNSMEGGNWRIKYELRVPYEDVKSVFARSLLIALKDSIYTFRHGRAEESFAHMNGVFTYSRIMSYDDDDDDGLIHVEEGPPPPLSQLLTSIPLMTAA